MNDHVSTDAATLAIQGEFTIFTAATTKVTLLEALETAKDIDVNLADVTEIDSAGLQLMVMAKREAAMRGKNLRFINHSAPVLDLIDLCNLSGFFGDPVLISSPI
jgi:anti-anti-sigma factor